VAYLRTYSRTPPPSVKVQFSTPLVVIVVLKGLITRAEVTFSKSDLPSTYSLVGTWFPAVMSPTPTPTAYVSTCSRVSPVTPNYAVATPPAVISTVETPTETTEVKFVSSDLASTYAFVVKCAAVTGVDASRGCANVAPLSKKVAFSTPLDVIVAPVRS